MLRDGRTIGAIVLGGREARPFTDTQVALLQTFADQAVIAIENVRLFTELETRTSDLSRSVERLTALGEVGQAVSSSLDLDTVLTTIVSRAVQLSGVDGGSIYEYDEARGGVRASHHAQRRRGAGPGDARDAAAQGRWGGRADRGDPAAGAVRRHPRGRRLRGSAPRAADPGRRARGPRRADAAGRASARQRRHHPQPARRVSRGHRAAAHDVRRPVGPGHPERAPVPTARRGEPPQVGVPRQHVARAAHAAQRHHRLLGDAGGGGAGTSARTRSCRTSGRSTRRASTCWS